MPVYWTQWRNKPEKWVSMTQHEAYITNEGAAYGATRYRNPEQAWHLEIGRT